MTIVTKKDRIGASRAKLALVGVLTVVLVVVIATQWPQSAEFEDVPTASVTEMPGWEQQPVAATPVANTATAPARPVAAIPERPVRQWPELSVDEVVATDPLAPAPWYLAAMEKDESAETNDQNTKAVENPADALVLAELQKQGATIVLIAGGERVATIGERQIHIGDRIEGYQVTDITDEGVILTKTRAR